MKNLLALIAILLSVSFVQSQVNNEPNTNEYMEFMRNYYEDQGTEELWAEFLFKSALLNGIEYSQTYAAATGRNHLNPLQKNIVTIPSTIGLYYLTNKASRLSLGFAKTLTPDKLMNINKLKDSIYDFYRTKREVIYLQTALETNATEVIDAGSKDLARRAQAIDEGLGSKDFNNRVQGALGKNSVESMIFNKANQEHYIQEVLGRNPAVDISFENSLDANATQETTRRVPDRLTRISNEIAQSEGVISDRIAQSNARIDNLTDQVEKSSAGISDGIAESSARTADEIAQSNARIDNLTAQVEKNSAGIVDGITESSARTADEIAESSARIDSLADQVEKSSAGISDRIAESNARIDNLTEQVEKISDSDGSKIVEPDGPKIVGPDGSRFSGNQTITYGHNELETGETRVANVVDDVAQETADVTDESKVANVADDVAQETASVTDESRAATNVADDVAQETASVTDESRAATNVADDVAQETASVTDESRAATNVADDVAQETASVTDESRAATNVADDVAQETAGVTDETKVANKAVDYAKMDEGIQNRRNFEIAHGVQNLDEKNSNLFLSEEDRTKLKSVLREKKATLAKLQGQILPQIDLRSLNVFHRGFRTIGRMIRGAAYIAIPAATIMTFSFITGDAIAVIFDQDEGDIEELRNRNCVEMNMIAERLGLYGENESVYFEEGDVMNCDSLLFIDNVL